MTKETLKPGCSRSHPHENMNRECELLTEIARLNNQLANTRAQPAHEHPRIRSICAVEGRCHAETDQCWCPDRPNVSGKPAHEPELCIDEGCPHYGEPHVCFTSVSHEPEPVDWVQPFPLVAWWYKWPEGGTLPYITFSPLAARDKRKEGYDVRALTFLAPPANDEQEEAQEPDGWYTRDGRCVRGCTREEAGEALGIAPMNLRPMYLSPPDSEAVALLAEMDKYLDHGHGTNINTDSGFHRQMKAFLATRGMSDES